MDPRNKINLLHITEDHSIANTGITNSLQSLSKVLSDSFNQTIITIGPSTVNVDQPIKIQILDSHGLCRLWRCSLNGMDILKNEISTCDIVHVHGLWMWPQWYSTRMAISCNKPALLTPHGMLESYIWERQAWYHQVKKRVYWMFFAYPAFKNCSKIHALTERESNTIRRYFPNQEIEIIPHGIETNIPDAQNRQADEFSKPPYILFLGRIHPVKGIKTLINAFGQAIKSSSRKLRLVIAGPTQEKEREYAAELHSLVKKWEISELVKFLGPVDKHEKWELLKNAWALCSPSYSEAIGIVNLEAGASATPVIASFLSGLPLSWQDNGGILINPNEQSLTKSLLEVFQWTNMERNFRGKQLQGFVRQNYGWDTILPHWISIYQSMLK